MQFSMYNLSNAWLLALNGYRLRLAPSARNREHWRQNSLKTYSLISNLHSDSKWYLKNIWTSSINDLGIEDFFFVPSIIPRKEVIQPHLPVRLPCYDFTPVTNPALGRCSLTVSSRTSGVVDFHGVTGGVYKTRERIQRSVLICVY